MSAGTRIVVTGLGALSAGADSPAALWKRAAAGESPAVPYRDLAFPAVPSIPACRIDREFNRDKTLRRAHRMDRAAQLALAAARQAYEGAGLGNQAVAPERVGVAVGSSRGPIRKWTETFDGLEKNRVLPSLAADSTPACLSGVISFGLGVGGPAYVVSAACTSGAQAIILAAEQLRAGAADAMIAGGVDAPLHGPLVAQFLAAGILDLAEPDVACRPFDRDRRGTMLGEGAAFLVLETEASACKRGARIYAVLSGWGHGSEGRVTAAEMVRMQTLDRVAGQALVLAGLKETDIDYLNAHGTGTKLNDHVEMEWLRKWNGRRGVPLPFSSTKAVTGHALGASSALEAVICIQALEAQAAPPSARCLSPDPHCPEGLMLGAAQKMPLRHVMSNSLGFWGTSASLIFSR
jgi:3-oxoacyl-[acyl-carrier-protein] synthase II